MDCGCQCPQFSSALGREILPWQLKACEFDAQGNFLSLLPLLPSRFHSAETLCHPEVFTKPDSMAGNFLACSVPPCPYPQIFTSLFLHPEEEINQNVD